MALGAFPSAEFLDRDFVILHVLAELFVAAKVILQAGVNVLVVPAARQVNFCFVVAFDSPAHGEGGLRQFNQSGVLVHQEVDVVHVRHASHGIRFNVSVAVLALKSAHYNVLLVAEVHVIREVMHLIPTDGLTVVSVLWRSVTVVAFTVDVGS